MAVPTYVNEQTTTFGVSGLTSAAFNEPPGVAANDHEIVRVVWFGAATACTVAGWTQIGSTATQPTNGVKTAWFIVKRGSGTPGTTINWTGGTATNSFAMVAAYRGATGLETVGTLTQQTTFSSSHAVSAISTSLTDSLAIALWSPYQGSVTAMTSGWTLHTRIGDKGISTPASSGALTLTSSQNTNLSTMMVALASVAVPAPVWMNRPAISGTAAAGNTLTVTGSARYGLSYSYQWKRVVSGVAQNIGTNSPTYALTAGESGYLVTCEVTATNATGSTISRAFGVSFYTVVAADIGHDVSIQVTATNATGTGTPVESNAIEVQFQNTAPPTISGGSPTMAAGTVLTASPGTYVETVTSRAYQWVADTIDIPGATSSTFTPGEEYGGRRLRVRENVTGPLGSGTSISTNTRFFPTMAIPFLEDASPWFEVIPEDAPVDAAMSATFQGFVTGQQSTTAVWWTNGGPAGQGFSAFINIVDSSMPRVPWKLAPNTGQPTVYTTPVKNGGSQAHLAWSWGVKNGGVPMHPCGMNIDRAGDHTIHIYCRDTHELWSGWVARAADDPAIDNEFPQISWGSYIPDVTQYIGYCQDLLGPGSGGYAPGTSDEYQYQVWGDAAIFPSVPGMIQQRYLQAGVIPHMLGLLTPGNNQGSPRYPGLRTEVNGFYSPMPPGGIIRLDPTLDPASLPSLGSTARNDIRAMFITCLQQHGMTILDTALSVISAFRIENAYFFQDSWSYQGTSLDAIMRSIPVTAYQYLNTSYRPAGTPVPPPNRAINTYRLTTEDMFPYSGCTLDPNGRLTMNANFGSLCYAFNGPADLTSDGIYFRVLQAADKLYGQVKVGSENTANGFWFLINTTTHTIRCEARYNSGAVGTDSSATYSVSNHAWLRLRESSGTLYWDTAPDVNGEPGSWTNMRSQAIPGSFWDITACAPTFYCPPGGTGSAIVTNLNNVPAPVATSPGWVVGVS